MKRIEWMKYIMMVIVMMFMATACSESNGDGKTDDPTNPETPVKNGDWQTIPVTGGKIVKDDITIDFPSGTFDKESKVAITNIEKGKIGGKYEASKFYKVTIPTTTNKKLTIRVKSSEKGDDINFVMLSPGLAMSSGKDAEIESYLNATYSDGEYTAYLPAINNGTQFIDEMDITFGIAHLPQDITTTRGTTLLGGQVGTVKWEIKYPLTTLAKMEYFSQDKLKKIENFKPILNECIYDAIAKINALGFNIEEERYLPVYLVSLTDRWGEHRISKLGDKNNDIAINLNYMSVEKPDTAGLRNTIIHELFHYFQTSYDPRYTLLKGWNLGIINNNLDFTHDVLVLQEMASVWIEQFTNGGELDANYLLGEGGVIKYAFAWDQLGFTDIESCWSGSKRDRYQNQGYSMAPLLYYITKILKSDPSNNIDKNFVHELFLDSKERLSKSSSSSVAYNSLVTVLSNHNCKLLYNNRTDDYLLTLLKGELVKGLYIHKHNIEKTDDPTCLETIHGNINNTSSRSWLLEGKCYPYGCSVKTIYFSNLKGINLTSNKLVIKQETEGVKTFLLITDSKSNFTKFIQEEKVATKNDSIVIDGSRLEKMRLENGTFNHDFFLVTMRTGCVPSDAGKKKEYKLSFELRDTLATKPVATINPKEMSFATGGGTKSANVDGYGFKHINYDKATLPSWLTVEVNEKDKSVAITAKPNTTGKKRGDTVKCYVTNVDNPTDKDKAYLPVTVTQDSTPPNFRPTLLIFEAKGGMQTIKATYEGYKYSTVVIDEADKSWLSKKDTEGGVYEITATPNTTSKERSTTIRCYFANVKNAPESERLYSNVKVTQKAGKEQTGNYQLVSGSISMGIYTGIDGDNDMGGIEFKGTDNYVTVSQNGKGLHVDINYKVNENDYKETLLCQFDIDDLTLLNSNKSKVTNLSWKVDTDNTGGRSWAGFWNAGGYGWIKHQTQKIRFSTSSKIPQTGYESIGNESISVGWFAENNNIIPSECSYYRSSKTVSEEVGTVIDEGKEMKSGSFISISLVLKK